jgi:uncharacterized protein YecA (UPF0149 family)
LPVRIEPPQEQQFVDGFAEMEVNYRAMRTTDAIEANARRNEPPATTGPIARSAPCPCGSGIKYKRCCGAASTGKFTPPNTAQRAAA